MPRLALFALALALPVSFSVPTSASAQGFSGAASFFINPSVRSSGMGQSGRAAFWGGDPNAWLNPALLGHEQGIRYQRGRTQLVPDLADDVYFTTDQWTIGRWGLGFAFSPKLHLDYGLSIETRPGSAEPIGTFNSYEDIDSWGAGINIVEFAENLARLAGGPGPMISRYADLSLGEVRKDVFVDLAPADVGSDGTAGVGDAATRDTGFLLRLTPYNSVDFRSALPAVDNALRPVLGGLRVDAAYGESRQNTDRRFISLVDENQPDPIVTTAGRGWAMRVATGFPGMLEERLDDSGAGWIARVMTPLLSFGKSWDRAQWQGESVDYENGEGEAVHIPADSPENRFSGWELTIANIYTIRRGRVDEPWDAIHGNTSGWGLGLNLGKIGGFRYDRATIPQFIELDNVHRRSWTAWVDPIAAWQALNRSLASE